MSSRHVDIHETARPSSSAIPLQVGEALIQASSTSHGLPSTARRFAAGAARKLGRDFTLTGMSRVSSQEKLQGAHARFEASRSHRSPTPRRCRGALERLQSLTGDHATTRSEASMSRAAQACADRKVTPPAVSVKMPVVCAST